MTTAPSILAILILLVALALIGLLVWLAYRFFGRIGVAVAGAAVTLIIVLWVLNDSPKARVAAVRAEMEKIPNVRMIAISDLDKQASESISALIEVPGKGKMSLTSLEPESFRGSRQLLLQSIGPFGFCSRTKLDGHQAYAWWIDIGPGSPIPAARELKLTTVQAAISHYDEILSLISDWPVTTHDWPLGWPVKDEEWAKTSKEEIHFSDAKGADYFFCLRRTDASPPQAPPGYSYSPSHN